MSSLTEVIIANMALSRVGISEELTSAGAGTLALSTSTGKTKEVVERWFPRCRNATLQDHPWRFARVYADLVLADDGTDEEWDEEWDNAYTYPSDCLKIMRFVTGYTAGAGYDSHIDWNQARVFETNGRNPWAYVVRQHDSATVILTNVDPEEATIEYTKEETDASLFPELFGDALAWRLAMEIVVPLGRNPELRQEAARGYAIALLTAKAHDGNEDNDYTERDGPFTSARGGD